MIFKVIFCLFLIYLLPTLAAWYQYQEETYNFFILYDIYKYSADNIAKIIIFAFIISVCLSIFILLPTGSKNKKYGYAKYANNRDVSKAKLFAKQGIIFGKRGNKFIRSDDALSCLILAPPGTGKTAGIVIPTLLTLQNSVIVHDPKGELYETTKSQRSKLGKIFLVDLTKRDSHKFNVFAKNSLPNDPDDLRAYITNISCTLIHSSNDGERYFIDAARSALLFFAEWLIWKKGSTSFGKIRQQMLADSDVADTIRMMLSEEDLPESILMDGRGVLVSSDSEKQWAGIVGTLKESLEIFADPKVENATNGECDFVPGDLRKGICSVYLVVQDKDRERLRPIIAMMINNFTTHLISALPGETEQRVTLVLDEFTRLGNLSSIKDFPAISRGYNANSIFVAQDYAQISSVYKGQDNVSIFETNCAYKIIFRQNNYQTAERISKLIGGYTNDKTSSSTSKDVRLMSAGHRTSESKSQEAINLVTTQDILNLKQNQCIILAQGLLSKPIKAKIAFWYKNRLLKNLK